MAVQAIPPQQPASQPVQNPQPSQQNYAQQPAKPAGALAGTKLLFFTLKGEKQMDSGMVCAVGWAAYGLISLAGGAVASFNLPSMTGIVMTTVIHGLVGFAFGYLLHWIFPVLYKIWKILPFIKNKVDDLFGYFFWPTLVFSIIFGAIGLVFALAGGALLGGIIGALAGPLGIAAGAAIGAAWLVFTFIVSMAANIIGYYVFAKIAHKYLNAYYYPVQ